MQRQQLDQLRQSTISGRERVDALRESKREAKEARKRLIMEKSAQAKRRKEEGSEATVDDFLRKLA